MRHRGLVAVISLLSLMAGIIPRIQAETITIAYLQDGLNDLQQTEKQLALKLWVEELSKKGDFVAELLPVATLPLLESLIKAKEINYAIINTVYYLKRHHDLRHNFDQKFWAIQRSESLYEEYLVITRNNLDIQNFSQLVGKRLSIAEGTPLMTFYLNYLVLKSGYASLPRFFTKIKETQTASQSVLDIYFGKSDACIVPKHILEMAVELNPTIMDHLNIIHRSGAIFIPALLIGLVHTPSAVNSVFSKTIGDIHKSPRGEQIINLFKVHSVVMIGPEKLNGMDSIYSDYLRLAGSVK